MGLIIGILVLLIFVAALLFGGTGILFLVTKLFRIQNPSYRKSIIIFLVYTITSIFIVVAGIVFHIINLNFPLSLIGVIVIFFAFHYILKHFYQNSWKKSLGIYIVFRVLTIIFVPVILALAISVRIFVFSPFLMKGDTMSPTYNSGDYLLIEKFDKQFERSDVVVFRDPEQPKSFLIKRIIGLPLEKVDIKNGKVSINGQDLNDKYDAGNTNGDISLKLGPDQYFVLGDNRNQSNDSRNFGPISKSAIEGKVFFKAPYRKLGI